MQTKAISSLALIVLAACSTPRSLETSGQGWTNAANSGSPQPSNAPAPAQPAASTDTAQAPPKAAPAASAAGAPAPPAAAPPSVPHAQAGAAALPESEMVASAGAPPVNNMPASSGPPGMSIDPDSGEVIFRTEPVALEGYEEAYTCMGITTTENMVIDGFKKGTQLFVHHAQFVKALFPEPEGISNCPEQFKVTWLPIFLAGAGASELQFDEGVGHVIPAGTQLVLQMHLYNASDKPVKEAVEIRMHKSKAANPTPVTPWAIGSADINVMPKESGSAQQICVQNAPVEVLAVFPHMHQLGQRLTIEVGKSMDAMQPLYARDPFNFDDQRMEKMKLKLEAGDMLRVTCDFKTNPGDTVVNFGESSDDEMCFFVGFALGEAPAQADCGNLWDALLTL
jgi:hypothetical protein